MDLWGCSAHECRIGGGSVVFHGLFVGQMVGGPISRAGGSNLFSWRGFGAHRRPGGLEREELAEEDRMIRRFVKKGIKKILGIDTRTADYEPNPQWTPPPAPAEVCLVGSDRPPLTLSTTKNSLNSEGVEVWTG